MAKNLAVVVAGSGGEIKDITIRPGTTARDILRDTGLEGYVLSRGASEAPFGENENVYSLVRDGDKLYASTPAEAG